jgi:hypothetical protein
MATWRSGLRGSLLVATMLGGCAGRLPEERGSPVDMDRTRNIEIGDRFIQELTAARQDTTIPAPVETPQLQGEIRAIADSLQGGRLSAAAAYREIQRWGRRVYRRSVEAMVIQCDRPELDLPWTLTSSPTAVISYGVAFFRAGHTPAERCAILVVSATGSETVQSQLPRPL